MRLSNEMDENPDEHSAGTKGDKVLQTLHRVEKSARREGEVSYSYAKFAHTGSDLDYRDRSRKALKSVEFSMTYSRATVRMGGGA